MKTFDYVCTKHPEEVVAIEATCLKEVLDKDKVCLTCGELMERYYGGSSLSIAYRGPNWPKRDIRERAYRLRKAETLSQRQKKVWDHRMPKLNLDPDLQKEMKRRAVRSTGGPMKVTKV